MPELNPGDLYGTVLPLLTFYLAFFTGQCYGRYKEQYTHLKSIEGSMRNIGIIVCSGFQHEDRKVAKYDMIELFRYLSASYYLLFCRLYEGSTEFFTLESAYEEALITKEEMAVLEEQSDSMRWFKLLSWAYVHVDRVAEREKMEEREVKELKGNVLAIRAMMNAVTYTHQLPVPLAYYHVITVLTIFISAIFSYASGYYKGMDQSLGWLELLLILFGFIGMREVAIQMADPFGDDDCDLPVNDYVKTIREFMTSFVREDSEQMIGKNTMTFHGGHYWAMDHLDDEGDREMMKIMRAGQRADGIWQEHMKKVTETDEEPSLRSSKDAAPADDETEKEEC